ncbi:MAG TPA: hypothetical protein VFH78_12970 [Candidatus Thermoplasmatota archaeon]|nr:hypothetical protein [Candidatus Thermoplasmatota archaeon]
MAYCTSCGRPLTPGIAFCTACGATVPPGSVAADATAPAAAPGGAALPAAKPRIDAGGIIGDSFRMAFRHFGAFFATQGVLLLLGALVGLAITLLYVRPATAALMDTMVGLQNAQPEDIDLMETFQTMLPLLGWSALSGLLSGMFTLLAAGFGIVTADRLRRGEPAGPGAVWGALRPRFGNYIATSLLVGIALAGVLVAGFALFFLILPVLAAIVVAIWLYLRWALAAPVAIFETRRAGENLARSSDLTKGVRGDLLMTVIVGIAIVLIPSLVAGAILGAGADPESPELPPVWVDVARWAVGTGAQLVSAFFLSAAFVGFYRRLAG